MSSSVKEDFQHIGKELKLHMSSPKKYFQHVGKLVPLRHVGNDPFHCLTSTFIISRFLWCLECFQHAGKEINLMEILWNTKYKSRTAKLYVTILVKITSNKLERI